MRIPDINPYAIRAVNPSAWPQYPYDEEPTSPEISSPEYETHNDWNRTLRMRDGVELLIDIYRPVAPSSKVPALCSFSPYTRQLQRDSAPIGQNEAGITEFWVPRGYAHVIVDVRGSNGSGGSYDMWGPEEQADLAEVVEWVAAQPWCNGNVGMMGCSYFGMTQNLAAEQQPPSLKAIFPYDAMLDIYRDAYVPGGIPHDGFQRIWFSDIQWLNHFGGRNPNTAAMDRHFSTVLSGEYPLDGKYYQERSALTNISKLEIPAYFGCHWTFTQLHLRGSFQAWQLAPRQNKRMLIGPHPRPQRLFANYHGEALRWYDHWLKGYDTGVLEGDPIHLWIPGDDSWRDEQEWPLARTVWTDFWLEGNAAQGGALVDSAASPGTAEMEYDPSDEKAWLMGEPRLTYRTTEFSAPTEVTGPIQLDLSFASSAIDTDWIAILSDEAPDGSSRELTRGWLRSSHRKIDPAKSLPNMPWHTHDEPQPLVPGEEAEIAIEIIPTSNVFQPGHRLRLQLANCDSIVTNNFWFKRTLPIAARNTVIHGPGKSRIRLPIIPRE